MIAKENGDVWCSDLQCWCWVLDVVVSAEWFIIIYVMCVLRMNWTDIMSQTDFFFHCHCRAAPFFFCSLSLSVQSVPCGRVAVNCRLQCKYDARKKHSRQLRKHSHFFLMFFCFSFLCWRCFHSLLAALHELVPHIFVRFVLVMVLI